MPSLKDSLESGLDFIEFLGDRVSSISKKELKVIYNSKFRGRKGIKDPNFSNVFFALVKFNKAQIRQGQVYINARPQVRVYCDQWRRPRAPQPQNLGSGPQTPAGTPAGSSTPVAPVLTPKKKLASEILRKLKVNRKELTADKGGIEITSDPVESGGKVQFTVDRLREPFVVRFHIVNKGTDCIHLTYYTALHRIRCFTLEDERRVTRASPLFLCPGESYEVKVKYILNHYGYFPATMYFEFCPDLPGSVPFCIVREIEAAAQTPLAVELGPVAPYKPFRVAAYKPVDTIIVDGVPPDRTNSMLNAPFTSALTSRGLLSCPLKMKNYSHRFHLLLHLEEIQMEVDIRKYDLHNQTMTEDQGNKKLLKLRVPGVAENRPSVLRGDCLRVSKSEDTVQPITVYTGYVHRVELDSVTLGFSKKLLQLFISNMKFNVEFTLNRYPLKLQHRAVDLAVKHQLEEVLFPSGAAVASVPMPKLRSGAYLYLENNPEQHAAVQRIVAGSSKPAPHLVFGPPGTGKTITVVEAINQVSKADPSAHILACAPSNSACDLLCERLKVNMDSHQIYRVYANSRDPNSIPKSLLKYCNWDKSKDSFVPPQKEVTMKYKVVVTTMVTAGRLVSGGIPVGHFSHVFVDEGGQAVEPECVIAIAGLLDAEKGQLVLAGDPKQLGPILRSPFAIEHGLGLSLLERLMRHNSLYQKNTDGHFDTRFVTKLLRNYRSHSAILKIPNELFYENELQVFADQWERETYCNWEYLPKKGFPVIFHGVMGKDEREANSPSFFNVSEIEVLIDYLTKLMETQGKKGLPKLSATDIGIIAPYRKQVEKIRKALRLVPALSRWSDLKELKVGSVEEFQGQERKIIMVSTVRSSINYVKMDTDFNIGFLSNEKRFNVALTRARSLLIVVGNPVILKKDPTWEKFISYCVKEKGYTGFDFSDAEGEDDIVSRLATLKISMDSECEYSFSLSRTATDSRLDSCMCLFLQTLGFICCSQ
uniref:RNA helicase n=1 Tax=Oreochromis niloticus TaxID=8128 RepID=A0A669D665_ORENI